MCLPGLKFCNKCKFKLAFFAFLNYYSLENNNRSSKVCIFVRNYPCVRRLSRAFVAVKSVCSKPMQRTRQVNPWRWAKQSKCRVGWLNEVRPYLQLLRSAPLQDSGLSLRLIKRQSKWCTQWKRATENEDVENGRCHVSGLFSMEIRFAATAITGTQCDRPVVAGTEKNKLLLIYIIIIIY